MKGKRESSIATWPLSFVDLEMTGLEAQKHEIVEVGLVKVSPVDLSIIETWEIKVRPEHLETADADALAISGYKPEEWKDAADLAEVMKILSEKMHDTVLAGWNTAVDYSFLDAAVTKTGIPLEINSRIFDVNAYASGKLGFRFGEKGLSTLSAELGISLENHHTALADAMACYEVYKKVSSEAAKQ